MITTTTASSSAPPILPRRGLATTLYLLTTALLFADQNLLAPNLSLIADEFGFDEFERDRLLGGDISIAFFMVGLPASFVAGCLADVVNRRGLLFLFVVLVGEGACLSTYFVATTFRRLYWCRALTGVGVGGALPLVYSVLGDLYEPRERGKASSAIGIGCGIGISMGQGISGLLGPRYGWRVPFLAVSVPAIACAVLVWMCVPEVERCGGELRELEGGMMFAPVAMVNRDSGIDVPPAMNDDGSDDVEGGEGREVEMAGRIDSRTTLVGGDTPAQGLYVQLNDQEDSLRTETVTVSSGDDACGRLLTHVQTLRTLLRCPSVLLCILQGAPGCIPW